MSRLLKISAGELNVRLHPHPADVYARWLSRIFDLRIVTRVYGDRYGVISMIDRSTVDRGYIVGTFATFLRIDGAGEWFDIGNLGAATDEQLRRLSIPNNLYPNSAVFYFVFDIDKHRLYFQTYSSGKSLTPNSGLSFFKGLSLDSRISSEFGEADITVVQDAAGLDRMFSLREIKTVSVTIAKPNSDVFDDNFEEDIEEELLKSKAKDVQITYTAGAGDSLELTDSIKKISQTALVNGSVEVKGRSERGAEYLKSSAFPIEYRGKYDRDSELEANAFLRLLPKFWRN